MTVEDHTLVAAVKAYSRRVKVKRRCEHDGGSKIIIMNTTQKGSYSEA
jgi:hypothetical protein